jgi:precorrin-6B methylase 1
MKNIITAAALALGLTLTAAAPVKAMGVDFCTILSDAAGVMATLRDQGHGPQDVYDLMLQNGIDDEVSVVLLKLVYVDASFASPKELQDMMFTICLSEAT